jgi:type I restriction enzyme S subunit
MSAKWPNVRLGEVLTERKEVPSPSDLMLGRIKILGKIAFDTGRIHLRTGGETKTGMILIRPGDLVVSGINAAKGAIAVYGTDNAEPVAATIHYGSYIPKQERVIIEYLWWLLRSRFFQDLLLEYVPGGIKTELKSKRFLPIPVPLPPLAEQRRIVARIEELAARIHEAQGLRQQAADEAEALVGAQLSCRFQVLATQLSVAELEELTSYIVDGPHQTPQYLPPGIAGIPFVTVKNMVTGKLDFSELNYISEEDHHLFTKRCKPERGDILYSKDGATRGRACYINTDREFSFFVSVALIKPLREKLEGRYLVHLLNSNWIKDRMADKSRGDMIPHIVLREIRSFPVPLASLSEQRRIVAELDILQAEVNALKRLQAESAAELDALLPSILDRAFS